MALSLSSLISTSTVASVREILTVAAPADVVRALVASEGLSAHVEGTSPCASFVRPTVLVGERADIDVAAMLLRWAGFKVLHRTC